VDADAPIPKRGRATVMIGRTVQSTTQRRDAMLDILRRRSRMVVVLELLVLLLVLVSFVVMGLENRAELEGKDRRFLCITVLGFDLNLDLAFSFTFISMFM